MSWPAYGSLFMVESEAESGYLRGRDCGRGPTPLLLQQLKAFLEGKQITGRTSPLRGQEVAEHERESAHTLTIGHERFRGAVAGEEEQNGDAES